MFEKIRYHGRKYLLHEIDRRTAPREQLRRERNDQELKKLTMTRDTLYDLLDYERLLVSSGHPFEVSRTEIERRLTQLIKQGKITERK